MYQCPMCQQTLSDIDESGPMARGRCPQHGTVVVMKQDSIPEEPVEMTQD